MKRKFSQHASISMSIDSVLIRLGGVKYLNSVSLDINPIDVIALLICSEQGYSQRFSPLVTLRFWRVIILESNHLIHDGIDLSLNFKKWSSTAPRIALDRWFFRNSTELFRYEAVFDCVNGVFTFFFINKDGRSSLLGCAARVLTVSCQFRNHRRSSFCGGISTVWLDRLRSQGRSTSLLPRRKLWNTHRGGLRGAGFQQLKSLRSSRDDEGEISASTGSVWAEKSFGCTCTVPDLAKWILPPTFTSIPLADT